MTEDRGDGSCLFLATLADADDALAHLDATADYAAKNYRVKSLLCP